MERPQIKFGTLCFHEIGLCPDHDLIFLFCIYAHKQHATVVTVSLKSHAWLVILQLAFPLSASCFQNRGTLLHREQDARHHSHTPQSHATATRHGHTPRCPHLLPAWAHRCSGRGACARSQPAFEPDPALLGQAPALPCPHP